MSQDGGAKSRDEGAKLRNGDLSSRDFATDSLSFGPAGRSGAIWRRLFGTLSVELDREVEAPP